MALGSKWTVVLPCPPRPSQTSATLPPGLVLVIDELEPRFHLVVRLEPITDENFYNEHAALLGHVALAWNDCHSVVSCAQIRS